MKIRLFPALGLLSLTCAANAAIPASSQNIFDPSPDLPTQELVLGDWRVLGRVAVGDGRDEITVAPTVTNTHVAKFTSATFTLTETPSGVEVVDAVVQVGSPGGTDVVIDPSASVVASDGIVLRALPAVFDPEAQFLSDLTAAPYVVTATACELPVVAEGVFVVELFQRSQEPPENSVYEYIIPGTQVTADPIANDFQDQVDAAELAAENYMNNLRTQSNGQPILDFILVSDPALRGPNPPISFLPPADWFPNDATLGGHYQRSEPLPNGNVSVQFYFMITYNRTDEGPLFVDPRAFAKTGTFVGGYGTPQPPNAPPDTLGDTQADPISIGSGDIGVIEPQFWSIRRKEIYEDVFFSGQMGMNGIDGRLLLRLREGEEPYFESSLATNYSASFRVWTNKEFQLDEQTYQLSPEEPIPLASFPIGPIECRITMSPFLQMGVGGELNGSAVVGWRENMTSTLSFIVEDGDSSVTLEHERDPRHRTGPFWNAQTNGAFEAFGRAVLAVDLTFSGFAGFGVEANADAVAKFTVDSTQTPWWNLETGSRADLTFCANVLGIPLAERTVDLGEVFEMTDSAPSPPDPGGKANAIESHWAQALTYPNYNVLRNADVAPLANGGLLVGVEYNNIDNLLLELDPEGAEVRRKCIRGLIRDLSSVHPLSDGGVIVRADNAVYRLDAAWNVIWTKTIPAPSGTLFKIRAMDVGEEGGNVAVYVGGDISLGPHPQGRAVVMKLDGAGNTLWANTYAVQGAESLSSLKVMPSGGCVAAGQTDAPWDDTRDPALTPAFPDDSQNACLVRIHADGTSPWAQAATPAKFVGLAVHPDGRIGAVSANHGLTEPWRGPGVHVFADDGEFLWASSYALDTAAEELEKGDTLIDGVVDVAPAPGGGFLLACNTGTFPEARSASHLMSVDGSGNPDWAVLYDWKDCSNELPIRVIDRGDSFFLLSALEAVALNGGEATNCLFMSCIPDSGLLDLFPSNRFEALDYYKPAVDNFTGQGVLGALVSGLPKSYVPVVAAAGAGTSDFTGSLSFPAHDVTLVPLTDSVPNPLAPPFAITSSGASLDLSWIGPGFSVFESCDLENWSLAPGIPGEAGGLQVHNSPIDPSKEQKFFRLEQTGRSE